MRAFEHDAEYHGEAAGEIKADESYEAGDGAGGCIRAGDRWGG